MPWNGVAESGSLRPLQALVLVWSICSAYAAHCHCHHPTTNTNTTPPLAASPSASVGSVDKLVTPTVLQAPVLDDQAPRRV
jgi:hypothetical protein